MGAAAASANGKDVQGCLINKKIHLKIKKNALLLATFSLKTSKVCKNLQKSDAVFSFDVIFSVI
jgi:hypothetical protein